MRFCRELLPDQERLLGTDHSSTLSTRASIAYYTEDNGDSSAALLADQERVLGADHPDTVLNRYRLGDVLQAQSQLEQAEAEYRVVLAAETDWLGVDHPDNLTVRYQVARCAGQAGNLDAALRLYRELLPDQERLLGTDHPSTLSTRASIATTPVGPEPGHCVAVVPRIADRLSAGARHRPPQHSPQPVPTR